MRSNKIILLILPALFFIFQTVQITAQNKKKNCERKLESIGVQLYTVRKELEKDFEGTLKRVGEIGYDEVEFAGLFGHDPKEVRKIVNNLGMKIAASHINWETFKNNPEIAINETKQLGAKYMVLAWFPPEERRTIEQWKDWAKLLNKVGKMTDKKGIRLLYHNHDFEFTKINEVEPFDFLLKNVDRRYVSFEIDLYWLKLGERDAESLFEIYPKGFPFAHVKDMSKTDKKMVDVGDGRIDFASIFAKSDTSGMRKFIVEHDDTLDPFLTLERSLKYLRELCF